MRKTSLHRLMTVALWILPALAGLALPEMLRAAPDPRAVSSINRGVDYLRTRIAELKTARKSLAAYAMLKAGVKADDPVIVAALNDLKARFNNGTYKSVGGHEQIYAVGVDLMFLASAGVEENYDQIEAATKFVIEKQNANGSWDYDGVPGGDTSCFQYAMLGLWSASRAGVKIPVSVLDRAVQWHLKTQKGDGSYWYKPGNNQPNLGLSDLRMAAAGVSSVMIGRMLMYPEFMLKESEKKRSKAFGILEAVTPEADRNPEKPATSLSVINTSAARSLSYVSSHFQPNLKNSLMYFYYTVERMSALSETEMLGGKKWYDAFLSITKQTQQADGSWHEDGYDDAVVTSFAILFLTRSTAKTIAEQYGGGLLTGGRGLPSDLANADVTGGAVKQKRKIEGPLDELLTELSALNPDSIADAQAAIVEKVQVGSREDLLGELDRIRELIHHPNAELRRTAVWALGRSGDLKDANLLIEALKDNNVDVLAETYNSLSYLSRKIDGVGMDSNPFAELSEFPTQEQKNAAMVSWQKEALNRWGAWYLRVRPYAERNDIFELGLRKNKR
jgi:hypothetical protein